jgi:hypothetical protein
MVFIPRRGKSESLSVLAGWRLLVSLLPFALIAHIFNIADRYGGPPVYLGKEGSGPLWFMCLFVLALGLLQLMHGASNLSNGAGEKWWVLLLTLAPCVVLAWFLMTGQLLTVRVR